MWPAHPIIVDKIPVTSRWVVHGLCQVVGVYRAGTCHCTHQAQSHSDPGRENMLVCDLSSVKVETQTCSYIGQFTDLEEPVFLCHQINIKFLNVNYLWEGLSEWVMTVRNCEWHFKCCGWWTRGCWFKSKSQRLNNTWLWPWFQDCNMQLQSV